MVLEELKQSVSAQIAKLKRYKGKSKQYPGIHIRSRPVVSDDSKPARMSIRTPKVIRWTSDVLINIFL